MSKEWHTSKEFQKCIREYHDTCARQPSGQIVEEAKEVLELIKPYIADKMKQQRLFELERYEHRGSTYEGVKVPKSGKDQDLEFDVMFVIKGGRDLECPELGSDGYAKLKLKPNRETNALFQKTIEDSCVSAFKTKNLFFGHLFQCKLSEFKEDYKQSRITCKISYHGPAVQIDVFRDGQKLFSIYLAPHFDLSGVTGKEEMYVPKSMKDDPSVVKWLRSFSLEEKRKFDGMDRDNGCRKMVLRTLKAFTKSRSELSWITSQHLKTALFKAVDAQPSWKQEEFGQRFMDVLEIFVDSLEKRNLSKYFQPDINQFDGYEKDTIKCTKGRLCRLSRNGPMLMKLLRKETNKRAKMAVQDASASLSNAFSNL